MFSEWKGSFIMLNKHNWPAESQTVTDVGEELFCFLCMLRIEGDHNLPAESQPIILLQM